MVSIIAYQPLECVNIIIEKINELEELFDNKKEEDKDIIAYDGKICCGSKRNKAFDSKEKVLPVNAMTAFNVTKDITIATKFIKEKSRINKTIRFDKYNINI